MIQIIKIFSFLPILFSPVMGEEFEEVNVTEQLVQENQEYSIEENSHTLIQGKFVSVSYDRTYNCGWFGKTCTQNHNIGGYHVMYYVDSLDGSFIEFRDLNHLSGEVNKVESTPIVHNGTRYTYTLTIYLDVDYDGIGDTSATLERFISIENNRPVVEDIVFKKSDLK